MCLVTFGPISRVGSKNACGVARVVCQEPPEPCTTLKATWTLGVVTDHRQEGGGAQVERAKNNVAQFIAVCRRSKMMSMGTRRLRRGSRFGRRWALQRRGDTPRLRQILWATKC